MFKLAREVFDNQNFMSGINALCNESLTGKARWNVARLARQIRKEEKKTREAVTSLANECFKKDENDRFTPIKKDDQIVQGQFEELIEGGQAKFDNGIKTIMEEEVEIESYKIKPSDLDNTKLTANQMLTLEPILDEEEAATLTIVE